MLGMVSADFIRREHQDGRITVHLGMLLLASRYYPKQEV
jgi:hypothetical protein